MRVMTQRSDFFLKHAPTMLAALVASKDYHWWRIGDSGIKDLAALACDLTEALNEEIDRRWNAEVRAGKPVEINSE